MTNSIAPLLRLLPRIEHQTRSNPFVHRNNFVKNFFLLCFFFLLAHASLIYDYGFLYSFAISKFTLFEFHARKTFTCLQTKRLRLRAERTEKIYFTSTKICVSQCIFLSVCRLVYFWENYSSKYLRETQM